jgi:hypothetical protein
MPQTLRDFINARESEVKASIKALNDELRELRTAKSAIDGPTPSTSRAPNNRMTHRDMIAAVLDERPDGGTSDKVIKWVNEHFDVEISKASMSSQLSRAKSDGVVSLEKSTKVWRSKKHSGGGCELLSAAPQSENSGPAGPEEANTESADNTFGVLNLNPSPVEAQDTRGIPNADPNIIGRVGQ